ncbi:MAG: tetratricopeptide repeat-containing glycosyltransferase family protein [Magnetococcus sp. DMHC-6]
MRATSQAQPWRPRLQEAKELIQDGLIQQALEIYQALIREFPDQADLLTEMARLLGKLNYLPLAIRFLQMAILVDPTHRDALGLIAYFYHDSGELEAAIRYYQSAIQHSPEDAGLQNSLGQLFLQCGKYDLARQSFEISLKITPDDPFAHWRLGCYYLTLGEFLTGWAYLHRTFTLGACFRGFSQPYWDGAELAGKTLLIHCTGGLGDTIQFVRYLYPLAKQTGRLLFECQPRLMGLFAYLEKEIPGLQLLRQDQDPLPFFDTHTLIWSLPHLCGPLPEAFPLPQGYLKADPNRINRWKKRLQELPAGTRIALAWEGAFDTYEKRSRNIPRQMLAPLLKVPGIQWICLQKMTSQTKPADHHTLQVEYNMWDVTQQMDQGEEEGFVDTAALMTVADLVITTDTSFAHLAGGLGCPTWLLLKKYPSWQWLLERVDSPWYNSVRLFRQEQSGEWRTLLTKVAIHLQQAILKRNFFV